MPWLRRVWSSPPHQNENYLFFSMFSFTFLSSTFHNIFPCRASFSATQHRESNCLQRRLLSLGTPATTFTPRWPRLIATGSSTISELVSVAISSVVICSPEESTSKLSMLLSTSTSPRWPKLTSTGLAEAEG